MQPHKIDTHRSQYTHSPSMRDSIIPTKGNKFPRLHINTCINWPSCAYPTYAIPSPSVYLPHSGFGWQLMPFFSLFSPLHCGIRKYIDFEKCWNITAKKVQKSETTRKPKEEIIINISSFEYVAATATAAAALKLKLLIFALCATLRLKIIFAGNASKNCIAVR